MGFWYWFRVLIMTVGLVGTILAIRSLNRMNGRPDHGSGAIVSMMGLPPAGDSAAPQKVNLCQTRVSRLDVGRVSVFQEGLNWYRGHRDGESGAAKAKERLDDVAVEKWFSRNCMVVGTRVGSPPNVTTALVVHFVNGEPRTLLRSAMGGDYEWMGLPFRSAQLDGALKELLSLPAIGSGGDGASSGANPSNGSATGLGSGSVGEKSQ